MAEMLAGDPSAPVSRRQLSGGLSQMTLAYRLDREDATAADSVVVRIPPTSGPLEPYDSAIEAAVMAAAARFGIAVPEVLMVEESTAKIGRPFYATRFVGGLLTSEGAFGPQADLERMAEAYVDQLAALHAIPVDAPLDDGRSLTELLGESPRKTPAEVLKRWPETLAKRDFEEPAYQQFIRRWLELRMPATGDVDLALVHGDYRLGNMLWTEDSAIAAAMDWEEAGLGDPYYDLAWTLVGSFADEDDVLGLAERRWVIDRYAAQAGITIDPQRLGWWEVACGWSLLCTNAIGVISAAVEAVGLDVRAILYAYLNQRIALGLLPKIERYELESK